MYEKLEKCPVCGESKFNNFYICKDHVVSGESFALSACENCGLVFTNPRPVIDLIGNYYESRDYIPHSDKVSLLNSAYRFFRNFNNRNKIEVVSRFSEKGKMLDVGCGMGNFLNYSLKQGWEVTGVEPAEPARQAAEQLLGKNIYSDIREIPENLKFNVISFWHVLEHIYDIKGVIDHAKNMLTKNGKIAIALPNNESFDARFYKEYWAAFDVPRHLYHFNINSFTYFIKNCGLKIIETLPMKIDAYYVSLLSEKNKFNTKNWLKAIINGYKSNSYAKNNQNNFSSLIYIIKK
jgi:SAM-dependent methyltransferase